MGQSLSARRRVSTSCYSTIMDMFRALKMKYPYPVQDHDYSASTTTVKTEEIGESELHYSLMKNFEINYLKIRTINDINAASILLDLSRPQEEAMDLSLPSPPTTPPISPASSTTCSSPSPSSPAPSDSEDFEFVIDMKTKDSEFV